jgi:hypothetical protein
MLEEYVTGWVCLRLRAVRNVLCFETNFESECDADKHFSVVLAILMARVFRCSIRKCPKMGGAPLLQVHILEFIQPLDGNEKWICVVRQGGDSANRPLAYRELDSCTTSLWTSPSTLVSIGRHLIKKHCSQLNSTGIFIIF